MNIKTKTNIAIGAVSVGIIAIALAVMLVVTSGAYIVGLAITVVASVFIDVDFTLTNILLPGFAFVFFYVISRN